MYELVGRLDRVEPTKRTKRELEAIEQEGLVKQGRMLVRGDLRQLEENIYHTVGKTIIRHGYDEIRQASDLAATTPAAARILADLAYASHEARMWRIVR